MSDNHDEAHTGAIKNPKQFLLSTVLGFVVPIFIIIGLVVFVSSGTKPNAGVDMTFDFGQLVAHVAKTRTLCAGSIVGSGTVSNKQGDLWGSSIANGGVGYCCLAEVRTYETIEQGKPATPFMKQGDKVRIEMFDARGQNIFGTIENRVNTAKAH